MADEQSCRRSEFNLDRSVAVELSDGQRWYFPKPWFEIQPCFHGGKVVDMHSMLTYGTRLQQLIEEVRASLDDHRLILAIAELGAYLLSWNYNLTDAELNTLFTFRVGEQRSESWTKQIIDIATGQSGPKASRDGKN